MGLVGISFAGRKSPKAGRPSANRGHKAKDDSDSPLILIADDNADNRDVYADFLRFCGYRVIEAENGQDTLRLAKAEQPDVILMDISMPQVSGFEATRE